MVSTYVPTVRPLVLRVHVTVPLPVPLAVVSVVHAFRFVADQVAVLAPVPEKVTLALSPGATLPCCTARLREPGETTRTNGGGAAVTTSVS